MPLATVTLTHSRYTPLLIALGVLGLVSLALLLQAPRARAAAVTVSSLTATSTNVYTNTGLATTTRITTGDDANFQLDLSGTPLISPQINIFNMGSTTMSGSGAHWYYASTSVSVWTEGPLSFMISVGGTTGAEATTTATEADLSGTNVTYDVTAPTLSSVSWSDTDSSTQFSGTDTLTLTFSETMATTTITTGNIDTTLGVTNSHTFGTAANGLSLSWNTAGNVLTVTLGTDTTITGADTIDPSSAVKDAVGVADATSAALTLPDSTAPATPTGLTDTTFGGVLKITTLSTPGASTVRYTTDGTTPTCSTGTLYNGSSIILSGSATVKVIACDQANNASAVASAVYTRNSGSGGSSFPVNRLPVVVPVAPAGAGLTSSQIDAIIQILESFNADPSVVANVRASLTGKIVSTVAHLFKADLSRGTFGADVKALQQYLNGHGYSVASSGPGSDGNETSFFGSATQAALARLQAAAGIEPSVGYLGPKTRAYIEAHP